MRSAWATAARAASLGLIEIDDDAALHPFGALVTDAQNSNAAAERAAPRPVRPRAIKHATLLVPMSSTPTMCLRPFFFFALSLVMPAPVS